MVVHSESTKNKRYRCLGFLVSFILRYMCILFFTNKKETVNGCLQFKIF